MGNCLLVRRLVSSSAHIFERSMSVLQLSCSNYSSDCQLSFSARMITGMQVVFDLVFSWMIENTEHDSLGQFWAVSRQMRGWRDEALAAREAWSQICRVFWDARGQGGFGRRPEIIVEIFANKVPNQRGDPTKPCPSVWAIMDVLPEDVRYLVFSDPRLHVTSRGPYWTRCTRAAAGC